MNINKYLKNTPGYTQYGADIGRRDWPGPKNIVGKFYLQRININRQGYDPGGAYWGIGEPLYCAWCNDPVNHDEQIRVFILANNRNEAIKKVEKQYPGARFYR